MLHGLAGMGRIRGHHSYGLVHEAPAPCGASYAGGWVWSNSSIVHTPLAVAAVAAGAIAAVLLAGCGRRDDAITRAAKRPGAAVSCRPSRSAPVHFERYHPEQGTATSQDDVCFTAVNPGGWMPGLRRQHAFGARS